MVTKMEEKCVYITMVMIMRILMIMVMVMMMMLMMMNLTHGLMLTRMEEMCV
jgi:hypothetical protein